MAQPKFTSRKPPPAPFDLSSATFATTPHPSSKRIAVPATSETKTVPNDTRPPGGQVGAARLSPSPGVASRPRAATLEVSDHGGQRSAFDDAERSRDADGKVA